MHGHVHQSALIPQLIPLCSSASVSTWPCCVSASPSLPWKQVHLHHFYRFYTYALMHDICFSSLCSSFWADHFCLWAASSLICYSQVPQPYFLENRMVTLLHYKTVGTLQWPGGVGGDSTAIAFCISELRLFLVSSFKNMIWSLVSVKLHDQSSLVVWRGFSLSSEASLTS